jgi:TonB family protein
MWRWRFGVASFLFAVIAMTSHAQTSDISVQRYEVPKYPLIAKTARVWGDVVLQLKLAANGDVIEAKVMSGPPMLHQASLDAVKKWRFYCKSCKYGAAFKHRITFGFRIDLDIPHDEVHVQFKLPESVVVTSGVVPINTQYSDRSIAM